MLKYDVLFFQPTLGFSVNPALASARLGPFCPVNPLVVNVALVKEYNSGGGFGVTEPLAEDAGDVPIAFVAVTVNVYAVPLLKPETVIGDEAPVPVIPLGLDVTVKPVIAEPPLSAGAENDTDACALPAVALTSVGAPGGLKPAPPIIMFRIDILS
jgi:hypothetical protein